MRLPKIRTNIAKLREETVRMGGVNYSDQLHSGDLRESVNLSARRWPYITTRKSREKLGGYTGITALAAWDKLVAVKGTDLLYDGRKVGQVTAGEKQFAVVNTKLVIWPDKVYLDTKERVIKPLGAKTTLPAKAVTFTGDSMTTGVRRLIPPDEVKNQDHPTWWQGNFYSAGPKYFPYIVKVGRSVKRTAAGWVLTDERDLFVSALASPDYRGWVILLGPGSWPNVQESDGTYYPFHAERYGVLTSYTISSGECTLWYEVYECPVECGSLLDHFKAGDAVTISGAGGNDKESAVIKEVTDTKLTFTANLFEEEGVCASAVTIERRVPDLDFICESENRLWGCGSKDQTVYASALGDPTNFYVYQGLSTDSYAVAVGSDGPFTGCCKLGSSVLFWKESALHRVLGSYPAEYALYSQVCDGVAPGCHKSLQVMSGSLLYMGHHGVYAYALGGVPSLISANFGEKVFTDAVAGHDGDSYYLSVKEGDGRHLFVYEFGPGIWVREDDTRAVDFARVGKELYLLSEAGEVWRLTGGGDEPGMEWLCRFAPFYETTQGRKRYTKVLLRLELPRGSWVTAQVRHDGGLWRECGKIIGGKDDVTALRIPVNRCDKFELRLRGKGPCAILSVQRVFSVGSDVT